jgi:hypothetical protein
MAFSPGLFPVVERKSAELLYDYHNTKHKDWPPKKAASVNSLRGSIPVITPKSPPRRFLLLPGVLDY